MPFKNAFVNLAESSNQICNVFSHWSRPCSPIEKKRTQKNEHFHSTRNARDRYTCRLCFYPMTCFLYLHHPQRYRWFDVFPLIGRDFYHKHNSDVTRASWHPKSSETWPLVEQFAYVNIKEKSMPTLLALGVSMSCNDIGMELETKNEYAPWCCHQKLLVCWNPEKVSLSVVISITFQYCHIIIRWTKENEIVNGIWILKCWFLFQGMNCEEIMCLIVISISMYLY